MFTGELRCAEGARFASSRDRDGISARIQNAHSGIEVGGYGNSMFVSCTLGEAGENKRLNIGYVDQNGRFHPSKDLVGAIQGDPTIPVGVLDRIRLP